MSLVLDRKIGEQVSVFKRPGVIVVTVDTIEDGRVFLTVENLTGDTHTLRLGRKMKGFISDDCSVVMVEAHRSKCKLAFDAPKEIVILRSELEEE